MYCVRCGKENQSNDVYCAGCGRPVNAPVQPLMPTENRIAGHVRLLGILWLAVSAFRLVPGMIMASVFSGGYPGRFPFPPEMPGFVFGMMHAISTFFIIAGVIGIITGIGLLSRSPWARMLAIIVGCVGLVDMPFGTALGIYTLWVLLPASSEQEYRKIAQSAEQYQ